MKRVKFQSPSSRKRTSWGLIAALALLLALGISRSAGASVSKAAKMQRSKEAEAQESTTLRTSAPPPISPSAQTPTITYTYDDAGRLVGADYGDSASIAYAYDAAGNLLSREVTASEQCEALTGVEVTGPPTITTGIPAAFVATVSPPTATLPVTYTWEAAGQTPQVHTGDAISDTATFTWAVTGSQVVTITAENCGGSDVATRAITVQAPPPDCPRPLEDVGISGPGSGYTDTLHAFTAIITPADATEPVTYTWSPEPESGQGTASTAYQWTEPGVHTITLTAENCGGVFSDTHTVTIEAPPPGCPRPLAEVNISGPSDGYTDTLYAFIAAIIPADATEPITYTWSPSPVSGQGIVSATYQWATPDVYTITLTAENCGGVFSDTHTVTIEAPPPGCPRPLTEVSIGGFSSGYTDTLYTFTAVITPADATEPVAYTWSPSPVSGQGTVSATYQWAAPNVHTITLTAENCTPPQTVAVSDTHTVTIEAPPPSCPRPLAEVNISGPSNGYTDTLYAFTAAIAPTDATDHITYTWSPEPGSGQGTADASYQWAMPDSYSITLEVENCGGPVSAIHTVVIKARRQYVYLPAVLRNHAP